MDGNDPGRGRISSGRPLPARRGLTCFLGVLSCFLLLGCSLPQAPESGRVTDADTGKPIAGAIAEAAWWCHDTFLPDTPGSYYIRSKGITDADGRYTIPPPKGRGGIFGTNVSIVFKAEGYIDAIYAATEPVPGRPDGTPDLPVAQIYHLARFSKALDARMKPAAPVCLKALRSSDPFSRRVAKEKLEKLLGYDYGCDPERWERAYKSGESPPPKKPAEECKGKPTSKERKLFQAAMFGKAEEIEALLAEDVNVDVRGTDCSTPLMSAAWNRYDRVVALLLARGADVNATDKQGENALMKACFVGHMPTVRVLLDHGADVNMRDKRCETALAKAIIFSHNEELVELLRQHGATE